MIERNYEGTNFITGIRAVAITLVFLIHSGGGGLRELGGAYNTFVDFGKHGVPMFFVISGFTIFHQLLKGNYTYSKFLKIRVSRISIPYFPLILLIFAYINMGGQQFNPWANKFNEGAISLANLFSHLTYAASFSLNHANTIIGVEWSLHIEIFFYIVIGYLIVKGILKAGFINLFIALIASTFIAIFFLYLGQTNKLDRLLVQWMPFRYAWMFILGGAGYYCRNIVATKTTTFMADRLSNASIILSIACIIILINLKNTNSIDIIYEGFFALLTFLLIVFVRDGASLSILLTNKASIWIGSISFSFYLLHFIVIQVQIFNHFTKNEISVFILNFALTALIAYLWFIIFEVKLYKKAKKYINRTGEK